MTTEPVSLHEATRVRYLNYAMSVISSRALPDVRDGLKPVQRRILYAMFNDLRLSNESRFRKCAAVVGEVMGKYHPHGDQSIYDAMVRLTQTWVMRYPLVQGQGNFGSLDGDNAAAMRYTEARLHGIAGELLSELKQDTVDFRDNFEGTVEEPLVLPAQIPHLLVNGAQGIAVGMATNIPPHNLREIVGGLVKLIDDPGVEVAELVRIIPAPDFPTGGTITTEPAALQKIYETGGGPVEMRGEVELDRFEGRRVIIIRSLPYMVNKSSLVETIAEHIIAENVPQLVDVRDESTGEVRVVCELKRGASPEAAIAYLYKHTPLRSRFHVNLTCLVPDASDPTRTVPEKIGLKRALRGFLDFRFEVVTRRIQFDLRKLEERIHILEGFALVFDALDEAIALIRASDDRSDAESRLQARFALSEIQASAVVELRLYRLARMEMDAILEELADKRQRAARLRALLKGVAPRWALIRGELEELANLYGDVRRTKLGGEVYEAEYSEEDYVLDEDARVVVTRDGWIKRQRSYTDIGAIRVREGDSVGWAYPARTRESVLIFSDRGRVYTSRVADLPQTTGHGEPIHRRFDLADGERVVGVVVTDRRALPDIADAQVDEAVAAELPPPPYVVAVSRGGNCLRASVSNFTEPSNKGGRIFMRLDPSVPADAVVRVELSLERDEEVIALASAWGRALLFYVDEINVLKGAGRGVRAMKLLDHDRVLGFALSIRARDGLEVETSRGRREIIRQTKYEPTRRGGRGREVIKRGKFTGVFYAPVEVRPEAAAGREAGPSPEDSDDSDQMDLELN